MDRKTLEYMEVRAKEARNIVSRIEKLKENAKKAKRATRFCFDSSLHGSYVEEREFHLVEVMISAFEKTIAEEIERLEQELAEL
jgi:uncharacterized protein (UPF0335 family)